VTLICGPKIFESADLTIKLWVRVNVIQILKPKLLGSSALTQNFKAIQYF